MSYRVVHLALAPHPDATSLSAVDYSCELARHFGAALQVTSPLLKVHLPDHFLAGGILANIEHQFERDAALKASELEEHVGRTAKASGLNVTITRIAEQWPWSAGDMAWRGRASDLCILGLPQTGAEGRSHVEDWLFSAGRPCILYPNATKDEFKMDSVLVCWDFSRAASRALFDALPVLKMAKKVRVLTVRGEKKSVLEDAKTPLQDLLAAHEIKAEFIDVALGANSIGDTILDQAHNAQADLVVLGAYGHSRLKEFVLGGATKEVLNNSRIPLLMSH